MANAWLLDSMIPVVPLKDEVERVVRALRPADFLRLCLSPRATSHTISFSISNSFGVNYTKRRSAWYIVRSVRLETEKGGTDVTIVAPKMAMSLHISLPKIFTLLPPLSNAFVVCHSLFCLSEMA